MFTGIVEEMGVVRQIKKGRASAVLTISAKKVLEDAQIGDSIAVNGICLTVTSLGSDFFTADVMHETLRRTAFSRLSPGSRVNLERAMAANGRFGGHIVAGHVDGVGIITGTRRDDNAVWYTMRAEPQVMRYIVEKGSITIDGISLTVAEVGASTFSISAIPHTVSVTVLQDRKKAIPSIWRRILSGSTWKNSCMPDRRRVIRPGRKERTAGVPQREALQEKPPHPAESPEPF